MTASVPAADNPVSAAAAEQEDVFGKTIDSTSSCASSADSILNMNNNNNKNNNKRVSFSTVQIREYRHQIGDNPTCTSGVPLTLDWHYTTVLHNAALDDYDNEQRAAARRHRQEMVLPASVRDALLLDNGISLREIRATRAALAAERTQRNRKLRYLQNNHSRVPQVRDRCDAMLEDMVRGMKRLWTCQKQSHEQDLLASWPRRHVQPTGLTSILKKSHISASVRFLMDEVPTTQRPKFKKGVSDSVLHLLGKPHRSNDDTMTTTTEDISNTTTHQDDTPPDESSQQQQQPPVCLKTTNEGATRPCSIDAAASTQEAPPPKRNDPVPRHNKSMLLFQQKSRAAMETSHTTLDTAATEDYSLSESAAFTVDPTIRETPLMH